MKIKSVTIIVGALLLGGFTILSLALKRTSDLMKLEANEIANAAENIQIAQSIKTRLLVHNRNTFLHRLGKGLAPFEDKISQRREINNFLKLAEDLSNSQEEKLIVPKVKQEITDYFEKRDKHEIKPISPLEEYNLVSNDLDDAIAAIDQLIAIKRSQLDELQSKISQQNQQANQISGLLSILTSLILLGVIISIFTFITQPLTTIAQTISSYTAGDLSVRINTKGLSEIQAIASNFNSMAIKLEEKRQNQLRFIASIAHDLRNPLNSISMASEILMSKGEEGEQEISKIIFHQVQSLDRLVSDLLDTTRIEAGRFNLNLLKNDIRPLIQESVELHRTGVDLHNFKIEQPEKALICKYDADRLSQVINNLLSNAIKYSPNGGTITVKSWQERDEIYISVSDQGIGVDPQDTKNIFKPFHRSKATKTTIPGIGLGLSASKRIIEAHAGRIWVDSTPGEGSTFYIALQA